MAGFILDPLRLQPRERCGERAVRQSFGDVLVSSAQRKRESAFRNIAAHHLQGIVDSTIVGAREHQPWMTKVSVEDCVHLLDDEMCREIGDQLRLPSPRWALDAQDSFEETGETLFCVMRFAWAAGFDLHLIGNEKVAEPSGGQ